MASDATVYSKDCATEGCKVRIYWDKVSDKRNEDDTHNVCGDCDPEWWWGDGRK